MQSFCWPLPDGTKLLPHSNVRFHMWSIAARMLLSLVSRSFAEAHCAGTVDWWVICVVGFSLYWAAATWPAPLPAML